MFTASKIPPDLISESLILKTIPCFTTESWYHTNMAIQCLVQIVIKHTHYTTNINNSHEVHMVVLDIAPLPGAAAGGFLETGHVQIEIL